MRWQPRSPTEAAELLGNLAAPWWIARGWALDCFVGRQSRDHADLDIEVLRRDQFAVQRHLADWDLHTAEDGILLPWLPGLALEPRVNSIWCRPTPDAPWAVQIMFAPATGNQWHYRRCPIITRPLTSLVLRTAAGLPFLAPEVQLLYKAKALRPKDAADFALVYPLLDPTRRDWLAAALHTAHPGHRWLEGDPSPPQRRRRRPEGTRPLRGRG